MLKPRRWMNSVLPNDGSEQLTKPLWEGVEGHTDFDTFFEKVLLPIVEVKKAWDYCTIDHPKYYDHWYRPAFSESEPWGGKFHQGHMGGIKQREHVLEDFEWEILRLSPTSR
jgi:hypothetical protein